MKHCFMVTTVTPPLERAVLDGKPLSESTGLLNDGEPFQLWPTDLLVCSHCWEVVLTSRGPLQESDDPKMTLIYTVMNPGNGHEHCEEPAIEEAGE